MSDDLLSKPGFQGSETSSVEVIMYGQGEDPIIIGADDSAMAFSGRYRTDLDPSLISVSTSKPLEGTGSFAITCKPARGTSEKLFERVVDDDWIDIVFRRHGRVWHTMRGTIDNIRRRRAVGANGATTYLYTITGRDFQKIFEITPLWFNRFVAENVEGSYAYRVYSVLNTIGGDPAETVQAFLIGWLQVLDEIGRANWPMPPSMPNTLGTFIEDIQAGFNLEGFFGDPQRLSISPSLAEPNGTVWSLAKEWSDPGFCELFCDLGKRGIQPAAGEELAIDDSTMSVFFRDRPFPLTNDVHDDKALPPENLGLGQNSYWFALPLHIIPRQQIGEDDLGRTGEERMNSFFLSPQVTQELAKTGTMDLAEPLWDMEDILRHGLRRYDIASHYKAKDATLFTMSTLSRYIARDWYAINPYLLNGSLNLRVGRPDIRVGTRVRIPGDNGEESEDETFYVEQVDHNWVFGSGLKTTLAVTRGWVGTDDELLSKMEELGARYARPSSKKEAGDFGTAGGGTAVG